MKSFYLKSITINKQCSKVLRKSLAPGVYKLADKLPLDIYGKNISVSAIVGMNGAGKSSLLDILFRVINNFSYFVISRSVRRNAAEPIFFIPGLYASIEYTINGKDCRIISQGNNLGIRQGVVKYYFSKKRVPIKNFETQGYQLIHQTNDEQRKAILNDTFFTVVTNYSLQAFNSVDYAKEDAHNSDDGPRRIITASDAN